VTLRTGRFGPYVQLGEPEGKEKPKRSSLPKGWEAASLDLEKALALLSLPREVGMHPEDGKPIQAGIGRYGPFILHDGKYANLDSVDEVFVVGINRAVSVIAEKQARGGRPARAGAEALKTLGDHPTLGGPITVHAGKYGPYVKHGAVNATLPKALPPETVSLDEAVALIAEKAGKTPVKKTRAAAKPKAAAEKKPAAKKAPAKKAAAKAADGDDVSEDAPAKKAPAKKAAAKTTATKKPAAKKTAAKKAETEADAE
jgi:DNA topoisomerase-1